MALTNYWWSGTSPTLVTAKGTSGGMEAYGASGGPYNYATSIRVTIGSNTPSSIAIANTGDGQFATLNSTITTTVDAAAGSTLKVEMLYNTTVLTGAQSTLPYTVTAGSQVIKLVYGNGWDEASDSVRYSFWWSQSANPDFQLNSTITYSVAYDANGGTGTAPATQSGAASYTVSANTFSRSGYSFNGWNTLANGTGTNYAVGSTITPSANTTLYAKWLVSTRMHIYYGGTTGATDGTLEVPGDGIGVNVGIGGTVAQFHMRCETGYKNAVALTVNAPSYCQVSKDGVTYADTVTYAIGEIVDINSICYIKRTGQSNALSTGLYTTPRLAVVDSAAYLFLDTFDTLDASRWTVSGTSGSDATVSISGGRCNISVLNGTIATPTITSAQSLDCSYAIRTIHSVSQIKSTSILPANGAFIMGLMQDGYPILYWAVTPSSTWEARCYKYDTTGTLTFWNFTLSTWDTAYSTNTKYSISLDTDYMFEFVTSPTSGISANLKTSGGTLLKAIPSVAWSGFRGTTKQCTYKLLATVNGAAGSIYSSTDSFEVA